MLYRPQAKGTAMKADLEFGQVEGLKIDVLTETGWFDDGTFKGQMMAYGGTEQSQYRIPWDWKNAGGYAALITVTMPGGDEKKILLDTGWNTDWMDYTYRRHGVDRCLSAARSSSWSSPTGIWTTSGASSRRLNTPRTSRSTRRGPGVQRIAPCSGKTRTTRSRIRMAAPFSSARTTSAMKESSF